MCLRIETLKNDVSGKAVIESIAFASHKQHSHITETECYSSEIFCVLIDRNNCLPTGKVIYVSQYACDMLCKHFIEKGYATQIKYLSSRRVAEESVKWSQTFESHMHTYFMYCTNKTFTLHLLHL